MSDVFTLVTEHDEVSSATSPRSACSWLLLGLVLAAFVLRVYRLDLQDIWWDEARNIDVAGRASAQIATAPELDIHPPVYFYLLHGWLAAAGPNTDQLPGQGAFAARFMSLWFGVLLVPLMAALGRRVGGRWTGLGAALGAAFLPFLLGEAQETRMYTVTLVWLACAGLALLRTEDRGRDQESGVRGQVTGTGVDFRYRVLAALRGLFGPGAADPLCRGLCPGGSVGLGSDVGAA